MLKPVQVDDEALTSAIARRARPGAVPCRADRRWVSDLAKAREDFRLEGGDIDLKAVA